jgi:hypothetical protein
MTFNDFPQALAYLTPRRAELETNAGINFNALINALTKYYGFMQDFAPFSVNDNGQLMITPPNNSGTAPSSNNQVDQSFYDLFSALRGGNGGA